MVDGKWEWLRVICGTWYKIKLFSLKKHFFIEKCKNELWAYFKNYYALSNIYVNSICVQKLKIVLKQCTFHFVSHKFQLQTISFLFKSWKFMQLVKKKLKYFLNKYKHYFFLTKRTLLLEFMSLYTINLFQYTQLITIIYK